MKKRFLSKSLFSRTLWMLLLLSALNTEISAQILAWQFGTPASLGNEASYASTTTDPNLSISNLTRGTLTASGLARAFSSSNYTAAGTKANAISLNQYYQFTVQANAGYTTSLSTLDYKIRRSGTGPNACIWQYSTDGINFFDIGTDVSYTLTTTEGDNQTQLNLSTIPALQNVSSATTLYFRLYAWGASATGGTFAIGRTPTASATPALALGGMVSLPAPTLSASALNFPATCVNANNVQNTSISGSNLNGSNVLIGPYSSFGFSLNPGGPFAPSLSLGYVGNTLPATIVYVQYAPTAAGSNSGNIPMAGGGGSGSISTTANANAIPTVNATANPGTAFCPGSTVLLQGTGASTYTWNGIGTLGSDSLLNPATAGTYTVVGTDANNCTASSTVSLNMLSAPVVTATASAANPVCVSSAVTLQGGGALSYSWNGIPVAGSDTTLNPAVAGTYTVVGTAANSCTASAQVTISTTSPASPPAITATPSAYCVGGNSNLVAVSAGNTIAWYDAPVGGTLLTSVASGANYNVTPSTTTTYYAAAIPPASGSQTFSYTGSSQTFTVPAGVTSLLIETWGAQGGSNPQGVAGGLGGYALGNLLVTPGSTVTIEVGGMGLVPTTPGMSTAGYNGGGTSGTTAAIDAQPRGGGGGGATDIRYGGTSLNDRVLVAAGGGGAAGNRISGIGRGTGGGGGGGYYGGGGGAAWPSASVTLPTGGTQVAGGTAGTSTYASNNNNGFPGALGLGGAGGTELSSNQAGAQTASAGAIGGGLTGGNGTYAGNFTGQSGAGGSSYVGGVTGAVTTSGVRVGNGQVIISWNGQGCPSLRTPVTVTVNPLPSVNATANPGTTVCSGTPVTLQGSGATSYQWNGNTTLGSDTTLNPATSGTYTVVGTDANGCSNSSTLSININPSPIVTATPATQTVCAGAQTLFNGGGADTYTWSGPQPITDGTPFTVTGAHAGTYTVTGTATATGCTGTALATLNVTQFQPGPVNPEVLYYKFDGAGTTVPNQALTPPTGTANAIIMGGITQGGTGQVGGALIGSGAASSTDYLNTGWAPNLGGSAWTIAFWSSNFGPTATLYYIFGDVGTASFRCFTNGVAGANNWILRGAGLTDVLLNGGAIATPTHNAFVYDPIANNVKAYLNGVLVNTVAQTAPNLTGTGPLKVMGYSTNVGAPAGGKLDEFRIYNRVVSQAEILQLVNNTGTFAATATPATVCAGANVTLNSSGVVSYTWNPGSLPGASVVVNPTSSTVYTVTGTDNNGCTGTLTTSVNVTIPPVVAAVSPSSVCLGGNVTFNGSGAVSYSWSDGFNTPLNALPFTPPAAGTSTYTVTGTDGSGCTGTSTVGLTVHALPNVIATPATQTICQNAQATVSGGGAVSYVWSGGISDNTPFTVTSSNTYTVTGTDGNGCTNTATAAVNMNAAPAVTGSITPSTSCVNTTAVPSSSGTATSYSWSGGIFDGVPFLVGSGATTYTLTGSDANGCTATSSVTVNGTAASGGLAPATTSTTQNHGDDLNASYYDASCNLIASVDDGSGGNILGLTTATVNVDATAGFHNGQPFVRRWYQITPSSNGPADVQLYLTQADFDNYNSVVTLPYLPLPTGPADVTGIANIRITKNADAGLGNSPMELTPTVNWNGSYWVLSFTTPGFSQFRVHSANPGGTPLPVALTKFDGRKLNSSNLLEWSTSSEMNNAYFNLQYSNNGSDFATIAKVDSKAPNGMSSTMINYSFEHLTPALGHNYYRLQQVDLDKQSTLNAKVVDLIWGTNGSTVSIYPNPTQDVLNIDLYTSKVQNTTVKVLDMSGRIVKQIQARSEAGMNKLSISLGEVAGGIYTVQVFENDQLTHVDKVKKSDK